MPLILFCFPLILKSIQGKNTKKLSYSQKNTNIYTSVYKRLYKERQKFLCLPFALNVILNLSNFI